MLVDWIESESVNLDRAVESARAEIALFREYRTRLIADVVTGKLDVREAAGRLPEEPDEVESLDDADLLADAEVDAADADLQSIAEEADV